MKNYFTIGQFAKKAKVTTRTIRYYDEINLLNPSYIGENNYRFYSEEDLVKLQRILLLKELGFPLDEIVPILIHSDSEKFQKNIALQIELVNQKIDHLTLLRDTLIHTAKYTKEEQIDWLQINRLLEVTNIDQKIIEQYKTANNLKVRIDLHNRYSQNQTKWFPWVFSQINFKEITKLLELGCGNGKLWETKNIDLRNRDIYLSDISKGMIESAKSHLNNSKDFSYLVIDCEQIPFKDSFFDTIIANHMLFYVRDIENGLKEIYRVISASGYFYCTTYGINHMKEITDLIKEFDSRIELSDVSLPGRFGLENGEKLLKKYFNEVEIRLYEDELLIDQAEPLIDYILSCHGNQNEYLNDCYDLFKTFIENKITKYGPIKITKNAGMFVCHKKIGK